MNMAIKIADDKNTLSPLLTKNDQEYGLVSTSWVRDRNLMKKQLGIISDDLII